MIIENNGIKIDAKVNGKKLKYKVVEQSAEATRLLKQAHHVKDEETGLEMRSNKYPSFNKKERRFYIRGDQADKNNKEVEVEFNDKAEARNALMALESLVEKISPENIVQRNFVAGSTSDIRTALIKGSQARTLRLTDWRFYPEERQNWTNKNPIVIPAGTARANEEHYNEHIGQVVDVLNKSTGNVPPEITQGVVNHHRVDSASARRAVNKIKELFDWAEQQGEATLVATWRLVTGLRAPDFVDAHEREQA